MAPKMMIPGAWEARHRPDAIVVDRPARIDGRSHEVGRGSQRRELTDWWEMSIAWEMSIFTAGLFAAMLLAMWAVLV